MGRGIVCEPNRNIVIIMIKMILEDVIIMIKMILKDVWFLNCHLVRETNRLLIVKSTSSVTSAVTAIKKNQTSKSFEYSNFSQILPKT